MLNAAGYIAECTADNLFVVRGGQLLTPSPQDGALEGITRGAILELAAEAGIPAAEARLTRYDVYTADECFVTGTGAELMPVTEVDGRPIADGKPGPRHAAADRSVSRAGAQRRRAAVVELAAAPQTAPPGSFSSSCWLLEIWFPTDNPTTDDPTTCLSRRYFLLSTFGKMSRDAGALPPPVPDPGGSNGDRADQQHT